MSFSTLSLASSFNPGSQLWIIASHDRSLMLPRLDWYLNFVVHKQEVHTTKTISETIKEIARENEVEIQEQFNSKKILLIPTDHAFPNRWLAIFNDVTSEKNWASQIQEVWEGLGKPSLRIFVPAQMSTVSMQQALGSMAETVEISLVAEVSNP